MRGASRIRRLIRGLVVRLAILAIAVAATSAAVHAQTCGNPDGDSSISDLDAVILLRAAAGLPSGCTSAACDVDGDGAVTDIDAVNVLRAAASLPATLKCPGTLGALVSNVEGADGTPARYNSGGAPVATAGAATTISGVEGQFQSDDSATVHVPYDGGGAAAATAAATTTDAGQPVLLVAAPGPDGVFLEGFFELPLDATAGATDILVRFANPQQVPVLRLATRIDGVVSEYVSFSVLFSLTADRPLAGVQIDVFYPIAKGSFAGSADSADCKPRGAPHAIFVVNDRDDGRMTFIIADATALPFPIEVVCIFDANPGATLTAADLDVVVVEVTTEQGAVGDPNDLDVDTSVSLQL